MHPAGRLPERHRARGLRLLPAQLRLHQPGLPGPRAGLGAQLPVDLFSVYLVLSLQC